MWRFCGQWPPSSGELADRDSWLLDISIITCSRDRTVDAAFVADLAKRLDLIVAVGEADVARLASEQGDGIEAAARQSRYKFLQQMAEQQGARYVATAHTLDDQAETVLFNVLRGTGLSGLAGIPRVRPLGPAASLIRPMLSIRRCEVISYLAEIEQDYCVDPTNASSDFARNRIRHELLPLVRREFNRDIDGALCRLSHLAGDAQRVIEKLADELLDRCASQDKKLDAVVVNTKPLVEVDRHLIRELFIALWRREQWPLQDMGFNEWEMLATIATGESARSGCGRRRRAHQANLSRRCGRRTAAERGSIAARVNITQRRKAAGRRRESVFSNLIFVFPLRLCARNLWSFQFFSLRLCALREKYRRLRRESDHPSPGPTVPPVNSSSCAAWPVSTCAS